MHNKEIRSAAKDAGVCLWEVAAAYGINDGKVTCLHLYEFWPARHILTVHF